MSRTYEMMILLDNEVVRAGWKQAKASVAALIEKHGGKVLTARRWDERKLAYVIRRRRRGTYLLAYVELEANGVAALRRELDLTESVLRYLLLSAEAIPAEERTLSQAESAADFSVPPPPMEDASVSEEAEEEPEEDESDEAVPAGELAEEEV
jgi:small subunit ribosomal protein S6